MSAHQEEKPIDKSPDGRYLKFDEELGRGTFKTVYRGLDTETGITVAWCELQKEKFTKQERQRFREEASMLKKLEHPGIVKFYDYWESHDTGKNKCIVLVTELMTSGTLKLYIKKFRTINVKILKHWSRQILCGLHFLHTRNPPIIHRDLKCDNIFITGTTGSVKIGDLGLSTFKNMTHAKSVIGTPEFMAPEIYDENYDEAVDVYAFGMCLLEMITGEYPYAECNFPVQIYKKVTSGLKPDCFYKIPKEYAEIRNIIDRCIRVNKNERMTIGQLMAHDFFASEDQYGVKIEIKNKEEDILKNSTVFQMQLRITDKKKLSEYSLNDDEGLHFFFDYLDDKVEDLLDQLIEQKHVPESDRNIITKKIKDKVNLFKKEKEERQKENKNDKTIEENDENSDITTSAVSCMEKMKTCDHSRHGNVITLSANNCCNDIYEDIVKKVLKKGRFNITTISILSNTVEQPFTTSDVPCDFMKNDNIGYSITATKNSEDFNALKCTDNNVIVEKTVGTSNVEFAPHTYAEVVSHQDHHEPELVTGKCTQSLSEEPINMLNEQVGKDLLIGISLQQVMEKNISDSSKQQPEENVIPNKTLTNDLDILVSTNIENIPPNTDNIVIPNYNNKTIMSSHNPPIVENDVINKQPIKEVNSTIQDLELELRKLSGVCGVKLKCDDNVYQTNSVSESISNFQKTSIDPINCIQPNLSLGHNPSTGLIYSQVNQTEQHPAANVEELKYLLEMAQKQITLQQQMLFTVIENKSSKHIEQCGSSKEDVNVSNNCGSNQILDNITQQKYSASVEDHVSQPQIRKISPQMNGVSEHIQTTSDNKKVLPNILSDKSNSINSCQQYQQSDILPPSQVPSHNFGARIGVDEVDKKLDSTHQGQKTCNDTISTTLNNVRKNSVTHVYEDKRKESIISNSTLNVQALEKSNNLSRDYSYQNSVDIFNEEALKRLSSLHCNLANLLSQEVEDVLNYQSSNDTSKNSSSCHSSEHHSIIKADLNVIEKETELFKIDKLVFCTLERHKKELLELRNRQCTELREIKHLSSLMALKTQELLRQLNVENDENIGKKT